MQGRLQPPVIMLGRLKPPLQLKRCDEELCRDGFSRPRLPSIAEVACDEVAVLCYESAIAMRKLLFLACLSGFSLVTGCEQVQNVAPETTEESAQKKVECLLCDGHQIPLTDKTRRSEYEGVTYYFCSETCLKKFTADPGKYAKAPATAPATSQAN